MCVSTGLFSSAAEAGPHDILKMYTPEGSLVNISNRLESNRPDTPYRLELVAAHFNKGSSSSFFVKRPNKLPFQIIIFFFTIWIFFKCISIYFHIGSLPEQLRAELALLDERYIYIFKKGIKESTKKRKRKKNKSKMIAFLFRMAQNKGLGFRAAYARPGLPLPAGCPSHAGRIGTAQTNSR